MLRHRLMEIDNHILGLTMEFERQNMIVTQWEMDKAKNKSDRLHEKGRKRRAKKKQPKIYLDPSGGDDGEPEEGLDREDEESGFEDNEGASNSAEEDAELEEEEEEDGGVSHLLYNNSEDSDPDASEDEDEEPEEVKGAWEELIIIQREQQRYNDIKQDIAEELEGLREELIIIQREQQRYNDIKQDI